MQPHCDLEPITLVMAIFAQPLMLAKQVETIAGYPPEVIERLTVIVVDDHGTPAVEVEDLQGLPCKFELYRVDDDIKWNQMGARNLGMSCAKGWCLMIDPDMVFSGAMMEKIMRVAKGLPRGHFLRYLLRHMSDKRLDASSPNTYLIHRDDFFLAGGYDEEFRGNKGWSDVELLDILKAFFTPMGRTDIYADFYGVDQISDAAVTSLNRSTKVNRRLRIRKVELARRCGGWKKWVQRYKGPNLRFKWTKKG